MARRQRAQSRHNHFVAAGRTIDRQAAVISITNHVLTTKRASEADVAHQASREEGAPAAGCAPPSISRGFRGYSARYATAIAAATMMPIPACLKLTMPCAR